LQTVEFSHGLIDRHSAKVSKREELLKAVNNSEDKSLYVKIFDYIEQVEKYAEPRFTQFLDPAQVLKAVKVLEKSIDVRFMVTSCISGCERNIICIYPDFMDMGEIIFPITAICIKGSSKFESISHRDILGALMNLGVKREKIGDIILNDDRVYVIVYSDISDYISANLDRIKHTPVTVMYTGFDMVPKREPEYKEIALNVASLRLDAVLSGGFGMSRSSLSKDIKCGNVKVNWEEATELSCSVGEGDVISLKGKGRIILSSIGNTSKKGRINIVIKKII